MTYDEVQSRLDEACSTLLRLRVNGLRPSIPNKSAWPDFVSDFWEQFAAQVDGTLQDDAARKIIADVDMRPGPPTASAITRMDEAMTWMPYVRDARHRMILWQVSMLRARGRHDPMKMIRKRYGVHRNTARNIYSRAIGDIAVKLD